MGWTIEYYDDALEQQILDLPDSLLARYVCLTDLMLEFGANLGMPHSKPLRGGLFELRLKGRDGIARIFYCTQTGKKIFMLHCFIKKSQKIPQRELTKARKRLQEIRHNDPC